MRNSDEAGETIAIATDDHTLIGGHHRLAVAASVGQKLFWKDTGEPVAKAIPLAVRGREVRHGLSELQVRNPGRRHVLR